MKETIPVVNKIEKQKISKNRENSVSGNKTPHAGRDVRNNILTMFQYNRQSINSYSE